MDGFFEVKFIVRILYFITFFAMFEVEAVKIECIKSDECSCKTNTATQQEISVWPMSRYVMYTHSHRMQNMFYKTCYSINIIDY